MTSQQTADEALRIWQSYRSLPPDERIEVLVAHFWMPPAQTPDEYEITLNRISEEMAQGFG